MLKRTIPGTAPVSILLVLALAGCSVTSGQQSMGSYMNDATITSDVKAQFASDRGVPGTAISVETLKGEVILSGFVKTQAEKDRAGALARATKGVTSVRNDIVVRP